MTIHFFLNWFPSCTFLYKWLSIYFLMDFRHAHFCINDYPFLSDWVFFMHISVQMTIHIFLMGFRHAHLFTNDYSFPCVLVYVMHISIRITIHILLGFSSCTSLCSRDLQPQKLRGRSCARGAGLERLRTIANCRFRARSKRPTSMA